MLNVRRGPSTMAVRSTEERINAIVDEPFPDTEEGRNRRLRTRLFRRLLNDAGNLLFAAQRGGTRVFCAAAPLDRKRNEGATGLVQETRREGVAMIDPDELIPT